MSGDRRGRMIGFEGLRSPVRRAVIALSESSMLGFVSGEKSFSNHVLK